MALVAGGAAVAAVGVMACGGGGAPTSGSSTPVVSSTSTGLSTSHNAGRDCTACHRDFAVAGTVYGSVGSSPLAGATIRFTSAPDGGGTALLTLTSDASGNFRTSQNLSFASGVYVDAAGARGTRSAMKAAVTSGACNSCHDSSRRITAG
jgi:cytochrome c556